MTYRNAGDVVEIGNLSGKWRRMPDDIRYDYTNASTRCPVCLKDAAGVPWAGWFSCEYRGCCVALVDTGEVFTPIRPTAKEPTP